MNKGSRQTKRQYLCAGCNGPVVHRRDREPEQMSLGTWHCSKHCSAKTKVVVVFSRPGKETA